MTTLTFALRTAFRPHRNPGVALVVRIAGMALAAVVLLLAVATDGAMEQRNGRIAWRDMGTPFSAGPATASLQVLEARDPYYDEFITRAMVVHLQPGAPVPPGLPRVPGPGEVFVSPELRNLIESDPALGERFGDGTVAGVISRDGLADSGELVAVIGYAPGVLPRAGLYLDAIPTGDPQVSERLFLRIILVVGIIALLLPVVLFIAAAARLDAQNTDARLAAMRLAGADPGQVRWIVSLDALAAALPGAALGVGLFFLARPLAASLRFDDHRFFASDFALSGLSAAVLLLVPLLALGASFLGLRGVEISPLGVSRRSQRKRARPWGPLLLALGLPIYWLGLDPNMGDSQTLVLVATGMALFLLGLALLGPWLGQTVAGLLARRATSAFTLLALRRIIAEPHASFRTVAGVVFAVFAGTLFLSVSAAAGREVDQPGQGRDLQSDVFPLLTSGELPLEKIDAGPDLEVLPLPTFAVHSPYAGYVSMAQGPCPDMVRIFAIGGECGPDGAIRAGSGLEPGMDLLVESRPGESGGSTTLRIPETVTTFTSGTEIGWMPDLILPPGSLDGFSNRPSIAVAVPRSTTPITDAQRESMRTALIRAVPEIDAFTDGERALTSDDVVAEIRGLVYLGTFAAFLVSGSAAAISVAGSILARRHSFALLRVAGVSMGTLRRTVAVEAMLPLLLVSAVSAALAVGLSVLTIWRVGSGSVLPPPSFALPIFGGLGLGLVLTLITLPILDRATAFERTRFE